jgi:hypothetical protein
MHSHSDLLRRDEAHIITLAGIMTAACVLVAACSGGTGAAATSAPPTLDVFVPAVASPSPASPPSADSTVLAETCENDARFVEDLTIPDGEHVAPGEEIDKRWSVQNTGSCDWGPDYRLVRISGDAFAGPDEVALYPARAGTDAVWQVSLEAPEFLGEYSSRWQAQAPDGSRFGDDVFVVVVVTEQ